MMRDAGPSRPSARLILARLRASRASRAGETFGDFIDLHIDDMCEVGKAPLRSKAATLETPKRHLGTSNIASLDRERLIGFGRDREDREQPPRDSRLMKWAAAWFGDDMATLAEVDLTGNRSR